MSNRHPHLCATCGVEHSPPLPARCLICSDERQYVPEGGQQWTSSADLMAQGHSLRIEELEPPLHTFTVTPEFAIGQSMFLIAGPQGSVLWDPVGLVTEAGVAVVRSHGPVLAIATSHPHMFGAQLDWSEALGTVPVYVNEQDAGWLCRKGPEMVPWSGVREIAPSVSLVQVGGHFPGSAVLHWTNGDGVLLTGDTMFPNPDRRTVSFMRSYPNRIPLSAAVVLRISKSLESLRFDRMYGNFANPILGDAQGALRRSADRHAAWARGDHDQLT